MKVSEAKEKMIKLVEDENLGFQVELLSEKVVCRCGKEVRIKRFANQYFIKYSDQEATQKTKKHVQTMQIYPNFYQKAPE